MVQVVTGDSQEEVMIFRDTQTHRHFIIIYISAGGITSTSFEFVSSAAKVTSVKSHQVCVGKVGKEDFLSL